MTEAFNPNNMFYPRSLTPNLRESSSNPPQHSTKTRGKQDSLYERILQRNYPPSGSTGLEVRYKRNGSNPAASQNKSPGSIYSQALKTPATEWPSRTSKVGVVNSNNRGYSQNRGVLERKSSNASHSNTKEEEYSKRDSSAHGQIIKKNQNIFMKELLQNQKDDLHLDINHFNQELDDLLGSDSRSRNFERALPTQTRSNDIRSHAQKQFVEYSAVDSQHCGMSQPVVDEKYPKSLTDLTYKAYTPLLSYGVTNQRSTAATNSKQYFEHNGEISNKNSHLAQFGFEKNILQYQENTRQVDQRTPERSVKRNSPLIKENYQHYHTPYSKTEQAAPISQSRTTTNIERSSSHKKTPERPERGTYTITGLNSSSNKYSHPLPVFTNTGATKEPKMYAQTTSALLDENRYKYSRPVEPQFDITPSTSKPTRTCTPEDRSHHIAPSMAQDPIPTKNRVKPIGITPLGACKPHSSASGEVIVKLDSDVVENDSQRSNYEYQYQPNRDIDKLLEKSTQNKRRLNLSVHHSSNLFSRHQTSSDTANHNAKTSLNQNNGNTAQHLAPESVVTTSKFSLQEIKAQLGKINSSNCTTASLSNQVDISTALNSQNNSLQSITPSLTRKEQNSPYELLKADPKSKHPSLNVAKVSQIEILGTPLVQEDPRFENGEITNRTEDKDSLLNFGEPTNHIKINELFPARVSHQQIHRTEGSYSNLLITPSNSGNQAPSYTASSAVSERNTGMHSFRGDKKSSERLTEFFEEYQNHGEIPKPQRSKSESRLHRVVPVPSEGKKDKEFLSSLKDFSVSFVKSTKKYLVNKLTSNNGRLKCSCPGDVEKRESCPETMKWLLSRYKPSELPYLKRMYEKLLTDAEIDPKCQKQIRLDVARTFPECRYYNSSEGEGLAALQRVLECFSRYDPQMGTELLILWF